MDRTSFAGGVIAIVVIMILFGFVYYFYEANDVAQKENADRCLVASGYKWNESENACVKEGLLPGDEGWYQVDDFKKCVAAGYSILNTNPRQCESARGEIFYDEIIIDVVNDFESCAASGYPVMESYPRQCRDEDGNLFVEVVG